METSLLKTKLNIPPTRPQLVQRPGLYERLQEGLNYKLVLVSAPAGFGKTTLLSEWIHCSKQGISTAWISLDEGDNDPVRFWDYFIASIQTFQTDFAENIMPWLKSSQPPSTEPLMVALINELANIVGDFVIVLDDYHLIESQQIQDGISYMLEHMPAQIHLVIATRSDPPLPLSRFRGKGIMLEVHTDELRFTRDEAADLYNQLKIPELSAEDIAVLNKRTEGWAVGLKMAALSMMEQKDIPGFIVEFTGSQRYVMDYLIEEVLHKQTQEVRDFLIKTSVLTRLSGPLCDAVTECQDSSDTLMELEQNHLFIVPLDESRNWYRYEHLFADILQHQLGKRHGDQEIIILHKRASQWYEDNDFPDDAIHHSLAAQDWERATRLTTVHGKKKAQSGQYVTLTNWLRQIPGEFLISAPRLYARYIIALLMVGEFSFAESRLSIFKKAAEGDDSVKGMIAHLESLVAARRYDMHLAEEWARKGLSLLPPVDDFYPSLNQLLGLIYTERGNYQEAEPLLTEAYTAARRAGSHFVEFSAFGHLAIIIFRKGELRRSADMAQQALERAGPSPSAAVLRMILSEIFYEWNDLETALDHVQRVIELGQQIGMMQARVKIRDILARIELSRGNEAGFLAALEKADLEARSISDRTPIWAEHSAHHVEFALARDDLADAIKWGVKLDENADFLPFQFKHFPSRLLIARGKKSEAADKLKELYDEVTQSGTQGLMIVYRLYQALAADNDELALEFLSDAMTMAEPEGYIRTFVDEGKLLKPLLQKALTEGITPEYTGKLLNIIEAEERMRKKARGGEIPLSERELEILRLLAADVSNQQIAEMLTISLSTVKTHVHHILEKLDAKDRSQAVFYARELELM